MKAAPRFRGTPLLIIGAGGLGRETLEAVRAINALQAAWRVSGFLDDDPGLHGIRIGGVPVLGATGETLRRHDHQVVITTGSPDAYRSRRRIARLLDLSASRYATVVHPTASLASSTRVGVGCVVLAGVVATADVTIGSHAAVMPHCVLTHDVVIGDFATLASAVLISGGARVGDGAYIGAGAAVREGCSVGAGALVGMGAVVLENIPPGEVWAGVPARRIRHADESGVAVAIEGAA